jgi:serpin B
MISNSYLTLLKQTLTLLLKPDFANNPAGAAKHINAWVVNQTRERIRNLIPADALNKETRLVLANAIYLKAPWVKEFNENATQPRPFNLAGGESADVPTMTRQNSFGYAKHEGFVTVAVPYSGGDLHLLILLPDTAAGLPKLESKLTPALLMDCARLKSRTSCLPKFKLEPPLSVRKTLEVLGMEARSTSLKERHFDGIAPRRPNDYLYISVFFTKPSSRSMKRHGAAAATAVVMMRATAHFEEKNPSRSALIVHSSSPYSIDQGDAFPRTRDGPR